MNTITQFRKFIGMIKKVKEISYYNLCNIEGNLSTLTIARCLEDFEKAGFLNMKPIKRNGRIVIIYTKTKKYPKL
jgi:hypothetical protein